MNKLPLFLLSLILCTTAQSKGFEYDIGDHRKIYMECAGKGSPTVLLLAGYPMRGDYAWATPMPGGKPITVFSEVSKFTRVCTYDRPGTMLVHGESFSMSRSTPVEQPVSVEDQVSDLTKLINAAQLEKPLLIVAHSAGGLIARMYAFSNPESVAGLILLDVTTEDLKDKWGRKEWTVFDYSINVLTDEQLYQHKELEWIDFDLSFYQMQKAMGKGENRVKLNIPSTVVLTADKKPKAQDLIANKQWPSWATQELAEDILAKIARSQEELAQSFNPVAKHLTKTNSGHNIQQEQPQLVIDEIKAMVMKSRARQAHG